MREIKYILFDAANTLIYKPELIPNISSVLSSEGYSIPESMIIRNHKLVSELIAFPDVTSEDFYLAFNSKLLESFGIEPKLSLSKKIFDKCSYLKWDKYDDTECLKNIKLPIGILSNFNKKLESTIRGLFDVEFRNYFVSEILGTAKPALAFYEQAVSALNEYQPGQILYIGDSPKLDVFPGTKVGMKCILIDRNSIYKHSNIIRINSLNEIEDFIV